MTVAELRKCLENFKEDDIVFVEYHVLDYGNDCGLRVSNARRVYDDGTPDDGICVISNE